jgi:single-strand DNA-binding protein
VVGLNKIMIIGNVGTDPEMRYTPNGNPVTSFRIASSRSYNGSDGERRQETEWFTVVAWNQLAETVNQYLSKGRRAYVEGRLQAKEWEGNDGQKRFNNEIVANIVLFLDRPSGGEAGLDEALGGSEADSGKAITSDDLPF